VSSKQRRQPEARNLGQHRIGLALAGGLVAMAAVAVAAFVVLGGSGQAATVTPGSGATLAQGETTVQGNGGRWTNVTADRLADMLNDKHFTLVDVKTPYIGEISGTDLYIPYDQLRARAGELPADKGARILVYCRSGVQSAQAAQTLLDLGYANVWNLDGGMSAWTASGRTLVNLNR
jgi:rhodanese-related sulfurtransferase